MPLPWPREGSSMVGRPCAKADSGRPASASGSSGAAMRDGMRWDVDDVFMAFGLS